MFVSNSIDQKRLKRSIIKNPIDYNSLILKFLESSLDVEKTPFIDQCPRENMGKASAFIERGYSSMHCDCRTRPPAATLTFVPVARASNGCALWRCSARSAARM